MSVGVTPQSGPPGVPAPRRMTVAEYHQLIQAGFLTENDKVELLNGSLVPTMPRNPPHDLAVSDLPEAIRVVLPRGWCFRGQCAITLSASEPEPDGVVARGKRRDYGTDHPGPAEIGLVIEVSDSTLSHDRSVKGPIYAEAGLTEYWIVNIPDHQVEVYTTPSGPTASPGYAHRQDYRSGDSIPFALDGLVVGQVAVRELLP